MMSNSNIKWYIFWMTLWSIVTIILSTYFTGKLTKTYLWEKVNVLTERWVKEYWVDEYTEDLYHKEYWVSPEDYGVYQNCVRWDGLYIPCENRIMLTEDDMKKLLIVKDKNE